MAGDRVGVGEQLRARLGQLDRARARRAGHERHADDPLERAQLLADGRLRVAEPHGGAAHRSLARDRLERGEVAEIEPGPFRKRADDSRSYPEFARARPVKWCAQHEHSGHPARRGQGARAVRAAARGRASSSTSSSPATASSGSPGHAAVIALPGVANPDDADAAVDSTRDVLREALRQGVPVLGICLGAELLAEAAGGLTRPLPRRVGVSRGVARSRPAREDDLLGDLPARFDGLPGARLRLRAAAGRGRAGRLARRAAGLPRRRRRVGRAVPPRADARDARRLDAVHSVT